VSEKHKRIERGKFPNSFAVCPSPAVFSWTLVTLPAWRSRWFGADRVSLISAARCHRRQRKSAVPPRAKVGLAQLTSDLIDKRW